MAKQASIGWKYVKIANQLVIQLLQNLQPSSIQSPYFLRRTLARFLLLEFWLSFSRIHLVHCLETLKSKNYINMSEIEELQLFSAVIFPASDPVVIIKETPTYDTGKTMQSNYRLIFDFRSVFIRLWWRCGASPWFKCCYYFWIHW